MFNVTSFPSLQLPLSKKTNLWKKDCVDYADSILRFNYSNIRNSLMNLTINYDLIEGKLHMEDLLPLINPESLVAGFIPNNILHYPIINSKLNVLIGEEIRRVFDYKVIVTNPTSISEIEELKKQAILQDLTETIWDTSLSEEEFNNKILNIELYYTYTYLDLREVNANFLLRHYSKEYNFPIIFNEGFKDAIYVGEEIYHCDIIGGEPILEKLDPRRVRIFRSSNDSNIEKADMVILEDYWSPGKIYDYFYDVLTNKDRKKIEEYQESVSSGAVDSMDNIDETLGFINRKYITDLPYTSDLFFDPFGKYNSSTSLSPYDLDGNIRVIRVYWKSRRKIKKIKYYDELGNEDFTFMSESYIPNEYLGEEAESFWVNEAWEGTKIGKDIYVNIRPKIVQYNTLDNPSRCHFGIIGSIYNIYGDKPYSMVDMMKPYSYMYDVIHDRLNKMMFRNWGKLVKLDLAKKPNSWDVDKWLYYAKSMGLYVEDSFNEGNKGAAMGKLSGAMNNNSQAVIDADFGNNIQQYINLLEFIKLEMAEVAGISKQREGLIENRETVGGVERATLQSSHITEWIFSRHDDLKRRVLTAFLETAKAAFRGRSKKFLYILPDYSTRLIDIDGDTFCESSYGIVVDSSNNVQQLELKLDALALAALLNQALSFSTIMKLYSSASLAEKQRYVENDELEMKQLQQEMQLQLMQQQQQAMLIQQQQAIEERLFKDLINQRDNETKITVAEINSQAEMAILQLKNRMTEADKLEDGIQEPEYSQEAKDKLLQEMKMFDKKLQLERDKLLFLKDKAKTDAEIKRSQISAKKKSS